jgi:YesN/AraC family two-component response regulator
MTDKKSILVVDDEELSRKGLSTFLLKWGYEVDAARNGKEALELFKKKRYDLLITDIVMPDITGIELLKSIKAFTPETGVIIVTGYGKVDSYLESMTSGAFEYLNKPINFSILRKTIEKVLHIQRQ